MSATSHSDHNFHKLEIDELLLSALSINDKLRLEPDGTITFTGSTNDLDDFRETVNRMWHKLCGWTQK